MDIVALDAWISQDTTIDLTTPTVSSGTDRLVLVIIGAEDNSDVQVTSMLFGDQEMFLVGDGTTNAKAANTGGGSDAFQEMWGILETGIAAASSTTITPTLNNSSISTYYIAMGTYEGVDQSGNGSSGTIQVAQNAAIDVTNYSFDYAQTDGGLVIHAAFSRVNTGTFGVPTGATEVINLSNLNAAMYIGNRFVTVTQTAAASIFQGAADRGVMVGATFFPAAGGITVTLDEGAYSLTGNAIDITRQLLVNLDEGAYALTGHDITITKMVFVELDEGAYALTGNAIGITRQLLVNLDEGAYTLTGNPIDIQLGVGGLFMATKGGLNGISVGGPFFKNPLG